MYQQKHICKEINFCKTSQSKIDSFELIEATPEQQEAASNEHELIKLRLNEELAERKRY